MKQCKWVWFAAVAAAVVQSGTAWSYCSPIVIDLGRNGIQLGEPGVGVRFDVNADGAREHVQWVRAGGDEAFLALDRSGNGLVDNGAELFGVGTPLVLEGRNAPNGFVGLAQYDLRQLGGNDDGLITSEDAIWPQLRVWLDRDANGIATSGEMHTLQSQRITALETIPKVRKYVDAAGNLIPYWAWAQRAANEKLLMVDVFFRIIR